MGGFLCRPEPRAHARYFCCMSKRLCCGPSRRKSSALLRDIAKECEVADLESQPQTMISWDMLEAVFLPGAEVWYQSNGHRVGAKVTTVFYSSDCRGEYFGMTLRSIDSDGKDLIYVSKFKKISKFLDVKPMCEFPVQCMMPPLKDELKARGAIFRRYCVGHHHLKYSGIGFMDWQHRDAVQNEFGKTEFGLQTFRADGRVMVDGKGFVRFNANYLDSPPYWATRLTEEDAHSYHCDLCDDQLWMTWPTLKGFSFKAKRWGELAVDGLQPIVYRNDAFDSLVMDPERKDMVLALVEHASSCFKDVVDEKGGGCVFLLHGPPGVGKTLTAEATAEVLKRPLYAITVGELGSSVESMEERLKYTLELGRLWDAVLLIDECDIFLERRDANVTRNAMTGIFLRLLEYHQGVLFLTSNRIKSFDPALNSRITVALHYPALDQKARAQVWHSMLSAAGSNPADFDVDALAADNANGRQIKNAVRFAQVMARRKQEKVRQEHCQLASKLAREFHCEDEV